MKNLLCDRLPSLCCAILLSVTAALPTSASEDVYRCRVLGDRGACDGLPVSVGDKAATQLVPGSYARYLIHNGYPAERAIAEAHSIGEEPTLQVVGAPVRRKLSGVEAHEQYVRGGPALDDRPSSSTGRMGQAADASAIRSHFRRP